MPQPYDASSRFLVDEFPRDWLALAGWPTVEPIELIDANLSTVTAEADKLIRVGGPSPWLAHVELQSSRDPRLDCRLFRYNALIDDRHDLPTRSVAVLLRPEADGPNLTGEYRRGLPGGPEYLAFRYDVVRVWREPVEALLHGSLGLLPLAPLADLGGMPIEAVVGAIGERIGREPPWRGGLLWTCTGVLMGLRFDADLIGHLLMGTREMEDSTFYQALMRKGRAEGEATGLARGQVTEARAMLLRLAKHRFGPISPADRRRINKVANLDQLRNWTELVLDVPSWPEFWALAGGKKPSA